MDWRPVVRIGGLDEHVAVQPHFLPVVLTDVRVVPVRARVRELNVRGEPLARGHRLLGLMRSVVAVLNAKSVPVDGGFQIPPVLDVEDDLLAFAHLQGRPAGC